MNNVLKNDELSVKSLFTKNLLHMPWICKKRVRKEMDEIKTANYVILLVRD